MALLDRRRLGTDSGRLRRLARSVERDGGNPNLLLQQAAEAKFNEGSAISSAEENSSRESYERRIGSGLAESARRSLLDRSTTSRPSAAPAPSSGAFSNDKGSSQGWVNVGAGKPASSATPAPIVPPRQGKIDGKPAGEVLSAMRDSPAQRATLVEGPRFGKDIATGNIATKGQQGAVDDYFDRSRQEPGAIPPGNMKDVAARDAGRFTDSPLQAALRASRLQRITDSEAPSSPAPVAPEPPSLIAKPLDNDDNFVGTQAERDAARIDAGKAGPPSSFGDAFGRDLRAARAAGGSLARRAGESLTQGARNVRESLVGAAGNAADDLTGKAVLPAAAIPGETGKYVQSSLDKKRKEARAAVERTVRGFRPTLNPLP